MATPGTHMRIAAVFLSAALLAAPAFAKLPPPTDEAKAAAAEAAAKNAWADKVGAYKLCLAQDRVVAVYRNNAKAAGTPAPTPVATPPCADPGPYVSQVTLRAAWKLPA